MKHRQEAWIHVHIINGSSGKIIFLKIRFSFLMEKSTWKCAKLQLFEPKGLRNSNVQLLYYKKYCLLLCPCPKFLVFSLFDNDQER